MLYNENVNSMVVTLTASGTAAAPTKSGITVNGDLVLGFLVHSTTQGIYFRLLDDGNQFMPVSGYFYLPADIPVQVFFERQILGAVYIEAYNPGASNSDLSINLFVGNAREKDLSLQVLTELKLIRQTLQTGLFGKAPYTPPEKE